MIMWVMSDRAIPRSFRFMEGFGVHTFRLVNAEGKSTFVKFHWKPKLGLQSVVWNEAVKINGADPDFHRRDLWDAIEAGRLPRVGARPAALRRRRSPTSSSSTSSTRPRSSPRRTCRSGGSAGWCSTGVVDNFFAETEQVAFCTQNVVPGIDFTNDPLLQGRNFSYLDTQLKRLGQPELHPPPDQRPEVPVRATSSRTGTWRCATRRAGPTTSRTRGARRRRAPRGPGPAGSRTFPAEDAGPKRRLRPESFADHYSQARQFYVSQTDDRAAAHRRRVRLRAEQGRDGSTSAAAWSPHLLNIDEDLAAQWPTGLGLEECPDRLAAGPAADRGPAAVGRPQHPRERPGELRRPQGRRARHRRRRRRACSAQLRSGAEEAAGARSSSSRPRSAACRTSDGQLARRRPEARRRPVGPLRRRRRPPLEGRGGRPGQAARRPATSSPTPYAHCKFIGYVQEATALFEATGLSALIDDGFTELGHGTGTGTGAADFLARCRQLRFWDRTNGG